MSIAYDMTWAEFVIKMEGYNRREEVEWYKVREIAYAGLIGSHMNPKKIPSKERFIPIGKKQGKSKVSSEAIERFKKARAEYERKIKENGNG